MRLTVVSSLNIAFVCMAFFLVNWVHAPVFLEAHVFTLSIVSVTVIVAGCATIIVAGCISRGLWFSNHTVIGRGGMTYVAMMNVFLYFHQYAGEQSSMYLWVAMLFSAGGSIIIANVHASDIKRTKSNENAYMTAEEVPEGMKFSEIDSKQTAPIHFDHPDFDFVLENLEKDIAFLQQQQIVLGIEALHKIEKLLHAMQQAAVHYQHTEGAYKQQATAVIENLCIQAEMVAEDLKERVQAHHVQQIEKLNIVHTK